MNKAIKFAMALQILDKLQHTIDINSKDFWAKLHASPKDVSIIINDGSSPRRVWVNFNNNYMSLRGPVATGYDNRVEIPYSDPEFEEKVIDIITKPIYQRD